ncbi:phosphatidylserine decarboxylase [Candidatus Puniceispirillum sp.]|nr:phosphatidylserine decarboxylase [Candidatus Puniceispirillum sp.]
MILGSKWKISNDGWPVLALAGVLTIFVSIISLPLGYFLLGLMIWLSHLLRVPCRQIGSDEETIYAPCDGVVLEIETDVFPNGSVYNALVPAHRITIQTRLSDAQLQTSPITGHIVDNHLSPGLFKKWGDNPAAWREARLTNERREISLRDRFGRSVILVQLGSKTARQLICRLSEGKFVRAGNPIGLARIAGVVDLYVPVQCKILVLVGQSMIAGETKLARFAPRPIKKPKAIAKQPVNPD